MVSKFILIKETYIWLLLAGLTFLAWVIGNKYDSLDPDLYKYMTIAVLLLAFFKVRLVVMYFMEIATAPRPLRILFEVWVVVVWAVVASIYLGIYE